MGYSDILALQAIKGTKAKQKFIEERKDDENFRNFLYYALNPLITYNLSENTLKEPIKSSYSNSFKNVRFFRDIFDCCEYLSRLRGMDDATVRQVKLFLFNNVPEEARELYIKLLSKTLRLGVTAKTVNKIIPNLIPEWEVQQAYTIDKYPLKENTEFWITEKLNGVRATFYRGQLIARSGAVYRGLDHIITELLRFDRAGFVIDGELTLKDKGELSDNEAFRLTTGIVNSDSVHKTQISYTIFDIIPIKDFDNATPVMRYSERRKLLNEVAETFRDEFCSVKILPVLYHGKEQEKIDELLDKVTSEDKEGLMINTDVPYKRTRHKGILKVKRFYNIDLPIIRCEEGSGRLEGMLGALVVDYKGNEVNVGSGFTDEQRIEYWKHREELVGTICEVKYKEISKDKNTGLMSLQFPVFLYLREDKQEANYE